MESSSLSISTRVHLGRGFICYENMSLALERYQLLILSFIRFQGLSSFLSLDRCSIPSREVSILWSYLDITLLFSSYVYPVFLEYFYFHKDLGLYSRLYHSSSSISWMSRLINFYCLFFGLNLDILLPDPWKHLLASKHSFQGIISFTFTYLAVHRWEVTDSQLARFQQTTQQLDLQ